MSATKADYEKVKQLIIKAAPDDTIIIDPDEMKVLSRVFKEMQRTIKDLKDDNKQLIHQIEEIGRNNAK